MQQTQTLIQCKLKEIYLYLIMDKAQLQIVMEEAMPMPEDNSILKEEGQEVEELEATWTNIWNFACLRYQTMKSWM